MINNLKNKMLCLGFLAISFTAAAQTQGQKIAGQLNEVFKQRNIDPIKSSLSTNFSVGAYTHQAAQGLLKAISNQFPCDSVVFVKEIQLQHTKKIEVVFYPVGKKPLSSAIYTDPLGQVAYVDIFDKFYGMNRYQPSKLRAKFPFEIINNAIVITLRLNNIQRPLKFLFDTGADGMAISQAIADSIGLKASRKQKASVVGGSQEIAISEGNIVHLDTFSYKNQNIAIFKDAHKGTDGLFGNSIAKRYIVKVDFDKREIALYDFGNYKNEGKGTSVPISSPNGLFIIKGTVNVTPNAPHAGNFVFDTGASYNLICFRPFVRQNKLLVSGFKSEYIASTVSMGISTPTYTGPATSFSFGEMEPVKNFGVTLMAGSGQSESWNPGFDGSIGFQLISRYNFTINMQEKEIFMTPNQSFDRPFDFVLGNYVFGFNDRKKLVVQNILKPDENNNLHVADEIHSINGITANILLNDHKKIDLLKTLPAQSILKVDYMSNHTKKTVTLVK